MSYLDLPRIHFGGQFQASPSTLNNTPNNYDPANWTPQLTELYWGPDNDGIFDLFQCKVSAVVTGGAGQSSDALTGRPVVAAYTNAPPKLVDLDPMQQNVSEIWGLLLQVGDAAGAFVRGTFEPISFNGIWGNAQGQDAPHSSASGSAVYQSTLTNLVWNAGGSSVLATLQKRSPKRLSVRLVVNAHNNAPQNYLFNATTFAAMTAAGVPQAVVNQLQVLGTYQQMSNSTAGLIPTSAYVNFQLNLLLGEQVAKQYGETILAVTKQPYTPSTPYAFNYGQLVGTLGPAGDDEPTYVVPARTLAPPPGGSCFFAQAKLRAEDAALTLDLGNSLPVELPGQAPWPDELGTLSLAYESPPGSANYVTFVDSIPYDAASGLMTTRAGVLDVSGLSSDQVTAIESQPLVLLGTPGGARTVLLQENSQGLSLRADQFVFRLNPGVETTPDFPRGETATVEVYVRKFGKVAGTEGLEVALTLLDEAAAIQYTEGTLGTSGTAGIRNLSVPQDALQIDPPKAAVDSQGIARFKLTGTNPGNPRQYVDGQIYFVRYGLTASVPGYVGDPNDLVSVQVYEQTTIDGAPTWANGIGQIFSQYGRLYPVMAVFGLGDHASVKKNYEIIRKVLALDMLDPLHMPVVRDLSVSRRQLIFEWMEAGMP